MTSLVVPSLLTKHFPCGERKTITRGILQLKNLLSSFQLYSLGIFIQVNNPTTIIIGENTELDTLWFVKVGGPTEGLTKKLETSPS